MKKNIATLLFIVFIAMLLSCRKDVSDLPARVRLGTKVKYEVIETNAPVPLQVIYLNEGQSSIKEAVTSGWQYSFATTRINQRITVSATATNIRKDVVVRIYINGKKEREGIGYAVGVHYPY
jgi:hypothetical protein